jgi:putative DNA primase/helicase
VTTPSTAPAAAKPDDHGFTVEQHRGQLRIAERLVAEYGSRLRHVHGIGWHTWDEYRWKRDLNGAVTRALITVVTDAYGCLAELGREDQKDLLSDIHRCESASGIEGVLRLAGDLLPFAVSVDQLDADPYLLNTANGTLNLHTGHLSDPDPLDLITKQAGCGYDPDAHSERFDRFLSEILPDEHVRGFVQRVFGHALVGQVIEHLLPIFTGTGLNGKSTLVDLVGAAFGDYSIAAEPDLLVDRGAVHTTGQADLLGVRLAVCSETDAKRSLAAATVKRLTGGDPIRARRMRQDHIEFEPSHSVLMVTNFKPKVAADDPALWRRLRVVPFDVVVQEPDLHLKEQLLHELPGSREEEGQ